MKYWTVVGQIPVKHHAKMSGVTGGESRKTLVTLAMWKYQDQHMHFIQNRVITCIQIHMFLLEGALRIDANVSVHREGTPFGTRTEIKNIGSVRGVAKAIKYEVKRQIEVLESGNVVVNETRTWDANSKKTLPMRDKEEQQV